MEWSQILILSLACWRIAAMLAREDGPLEMFAWVRMSLGQRFDEKSEPYVPPFHETGVLRYARWSFLSGLTCVACASIWWGIFFTLLWLLTPAGAFGLAFPFALSAAALIIERLVNNA